MKSIGRMLRALLAGRRFETIERSKLEADLEAFLRESLPSYPKGVRGFVISEVTREEVGGYIRATIMISDELLDALSTDDRETLEKAAR